MNITDKRSKTVQNENSNGFFFSLGNWKKKKDENVYSPLLLLEYAIV